MNFIEVLPYEIVVNILGLLDIHQRFKCTNVCKAWKIISQDSSLWHSIDFSHLTVNYINTLITNIIETHGKSITSISTSYTQAEQLTGSTIIAISNNFINLTKLNIGVQPRDNNKVDDSSLILLSRHCTKLRYLNTTGFKKIKINSIGQIIQNCSELQHLNIMKDNITQKGSEAMQCIGKYCPNLRFLNTLESSYINDNFTIQSIVAHCYKIQQTFCRWSY